MQAFLFINEMQWIEIESVSKAVVHIVHSIYTESDYQELHAFMVSWVMHQKPIGILRNKRTLNAAANKMPDRGAARDVTQRSCAVFRFTEQTSGIISHIATTRNASLNAQNLLPWFTQQRWVTKTNGWTLYPWWVRHSRIQSLCGGTYSLVKPTRRWWQLSTSLIGFYQTDHLPWGNCWLSRSSMDMSPWTTKSRTQQALQWLVRRHPPSWFECSTCWAHSIQLLQDQSTKPHQH